MRVLYTDIDPFCCEVLRERVKDGGLPPGEVIERDVTALDPRGFTQIHLFCGIGGIPLGLHWAGWPAEWSIVTGGFPCQDVSVAGKGLGVDKGARSGLWKEMHRVIDIVRPTWVLAENVPALRTRGADRVLGDLEQLGYSCWPLVVGAEHVGAPHRRHRVWIVGHAHDGGRGREERAVRKGKGSNTERVFAEPGDVGDTSRQLIRGKQRRGVGAGKQAHGERAPDHDDAGGSTAALPNALSTGRRAWSREQGDEGRAGSGRGESAGGVQPGGLADTTGRGLGADGSAREGGGHADERGAGVVDTDGERGCRRTARRGDAADARIAGQARWPMPPGPRQHKWEAPRLIESGVGLSVARFSRWLARFGLDRLSESHYLVLNYGTTTGKRTDEVLRELRNSIESDRVSEWKAGRFGGVQAAEVLLAYLLRVEAVRGAADKQGNVPPPREEAPQRSVRGVWNEAETARAPHRPRPQKQRSKEHPDTLLGVSRLLALRCEEEWKTYCRQDAAAMGRWRRNALKALGNAVVPEVVEVVACGMIEFGRSQA